MWEIYTDLDNIDNIEVIKLNEYDKAINLDLIKLFINDAMNEPDIRYYITPNSDVFLLFHKNKVCGAIMTYITNEGIFIIGSTHPKMKQECWKKILNTLKEYAIINNQKRLFGHIYNPTLIPRLKSLGAKTKYVCMEYLINE